MHLKQDKAHDVSETRADRLPMPFGSAAALRLITCQATPSARCRCSVFVILRRQEGELNLQFSLSFNQQR